MDEKAGMLDGITVVDLTLFLPGPMLTMMMAAEGARVIKVEPPGGDPARQMAPFHEGRSFWFHSLNHAKECRELDLKAEPDRAALAGLIAKADVLVEGFRPGVMQRLGFGWGATRALNPGLVYCSLSAFGQEGPLAHHPAHDLGAQALTGFLSVNDGRDGTPVVPGVPAADMAAGLTGLSAILMALLARQRTGEGRHLDIAMADSLFPWSVHIAGNAILHGEPVRSAAQRSLGGAAFYRVYACADGRHIVLCGREEKFVRTLLTDLGRPDLVVEALAPAGEQGKAVAFLADTFRQRDRDDWAAWFEGRDIAFAPVLDFAEAARSPHVAERGLLATADGQPVVASPIH
jgi:crotonobetainyl-CoA:carnitine CoA-transferase CaiB-like acyl-CoA transferase